MLDKTKLIPFKGKHSVSEVIFSFFLANPIVNPQSFETLLMKGQPLHEKFQRFSMNIQLNFNLKPNQNLPSVQPQVSKTGKDGFSMEGYKDGKPDWFIRYQPQVFPTFANILSLHCLDYEDWDIFYESAFAYCKIISDFDSTIFVTGYALNYLDQFNWTDKELPQMNDIFKIESDYLPKLVFETKGIWNFTGTFSRQIDDQLINEAASIGANQVAENNYNIFLLHQSSCTFSETRKLKDLCDGNVKLKPFADKLHDLNKAFLSQTLVDEILIDIGNKK